MAYTSLQNGACGKAFSLAFSLFRRARLRAWQQDCKAVLHSCDKPHTKLTETVQQPQTRTGRYHQLSSKLVLCYLTDTVASFLPEKHASVKFECTQLCLPNADTTNNFDALRKWPLFPLRGLTGFTPTTPWATTALHHCVKCSGFQLSLSIKWVHLLWPVNDSLS